MKEVLEPLYTKPFFAWLDKDENKNVRLSIRIGLPLPVICFLILIITYFGDLLGSWDIVGSYLPHWFWMVFFVLGLTYCMLAVYYFVRPKVPTKRMSALFLTFGVGTFCFLTGYLIKPTEMPGNALVVAVTKFNSVGKSSEDDAIAIPNRIRNRLQETLNSEKRYDDSDSPLIVVKFLKKVQVEGQDEQLILRSAEEKARKASADMIIWGDVCKEEGTLETSVRMAVVKSLGDVQLQIRPLLMAEAYNPSLLTFKKRLANEVSQLTYFICGTVYFQSSKYDLALRAFDKVETQESYLYKGMIHSQRAYDVPATSLELLKAKDLLEKASTLDSARIVAAEGLKWEITFNHATVLVRLGLLTSPEESQSFLERARIEYLKCADSRTKEETPKKWVRAQIQLGYTVTEIGLRKSGEEKREFLAQAGQILEEARSVCVQKGLSDSAAECDLYKGIALRYLSRTDESEQDLQILKQAIGSFDSSLTVFSKTKFPLH